jgi:hypothetical protein
MCKQKVRRVRFTFFKFKFIILKYIPPKSNNFADFQLSSNVYSFKLPKNGYIEIIKVM